MVKKFHFYLFLHQFFMILTRYVILGSISIPAAKARDSTSNDDHEDDRNASDDEQQFQVDLTISSGKPRTTFASNHRRIV